MYFKMQTLKECFGLALHKLKIWALKGPRHLAVEEKQKIKNNAVTIKKNTKSLPRNKGKQREGIPKIPNYPSIHSTNK